MGVPVALGLCVAEGVPDGLGVGTALGVGELDRVTRWDAVGVPVPDRVGRAVLLPVGVEVAD